MISYKKKYEKYHNKIKKIGYELQHSQKGGLIKIENDYDLLYKFNEIIDIPIIDKTKINNLEKISRGGNGCVFKTSYENDGNTFRLIIKKSFTSSSDNNYYEFLVGMCINKIKQYFPNFVFTFGYYTSNQIRCDTDTHIFDIDTSNIINFNNDMINLLNKYNIRDGCNNNHISGLILQNVPNLVNINYILNKPHSSVANINREMYNILFQVYTTLHFTSEYYTHYDLSINNILYSLVPNNKFMKITYQMPNGTNIILYTQYIPIIIDYGRSHINFDKIIPSFSSFNIYETMCKTRCNKYFDIIGRCYSEYGFISKKINDIYMDKCDKYYINPIISNKSHDLLYINQIMEIIQNEKPTFRILSEFDKYSNNIRTCTLVEKHAFSKYNTINVGSPSLESSYTTKTIEEKSLIKKLPSIESINDKRFCKNQPLDENRERRKIAVINNVTDCYNWLLDEYHMYYNDSKPSDDLIYGELKIFPQINLSEQFSDERKKFQFIPSEV